MKKYILFTFLLLIVLSAFPQSELRGIVVDKDSNPLADIIVQYGSMSKDYIYTNENGHFLIPTNSEDVIHFQGIGYKPKSVLRSVLEKNSRVELEINPVSLNPIIISPGDADALLEEVMINTKKKLLTDLPIAYLLHFLQTKSSDTLQNEIYMKYASTLSAKDLKKNMKKDYVPYKYNIVGIRRTQKSITPPSDLYGAEYHASHLFSFGKSVNNETTRGYTSDSSLIILNIEPLEGKEGWAKGELYIRKDDMTLVSMEVTSVDSILEAQPYKDHMEKKIKIVRKVGRFQFAEVNNKYYLKESLTYYKFHVVDEYGKEEEVTYYCDVNCIGHIEKNKIKKRTLSGYCQELFYFPDSTTREFWLEEGFIEPGSMEDKTKGLSDGIAPDKPYEVQTKWYKALYFIPALSLLFIL